MFAKNSKAYSVYLLFRFVFSLAVSMSTVLSIVYHLEVVQLDAFQLVLVGTVLETSCFLFEIPTGVVADLYSRRRSVLIGMFLYGLGFLMEGALPWFAPVLLAQVVWGCGDTFITGALEAWIASEEEDKPIDKVFLRGSQMGQIGGVLGVVLALLGLGAWSLVWMQLVTSILRFVFAFAQVPWIPQFQFNKPLTIQMFRFGCNLLLINIIGVICDNLPSFVIGKLFSPSQLGYYSKSRKIPFFFVNGVKWSVGGTIFPALSAQQNDRIVQRKIVCNGIIFSSFLLMPLLAFLAGAGNNIILILLGHNWMPTVPYMQIAIAGFLFWPLHAVNREVLIANGCGKFLLRLELLNKLFFIACFAIGILGGVSGILWGMALSSLLTFVIYSQGSRRILNYGALQQVKDVARIVGCASLAGIVVWLEERLMVNCVFLLLIQVGTGIVLYLAASLLINREQSIAAWRILERVRNGLRTRSLFA